MPHPKADYTFCFRRVVKFLGVADPNHPEGDRVMSTSPYTDQMIKSQICQSDVEVCSLIASTEGHPFRNEYFTETPATLSSGEKIPSYIGVHGKVEVLVGADWELGRLAQSLEHLQRVRDKFETGADVLDSSLPLYWIDNGQAYTIDRTGSIRVEVPTIPIADDTDTTPGLSTPMQSANAVIAHAIFTLRPVGADQQHRVDWASIWTGYVQMIISGKASLPEPEAMQRTAS